MIELVFGENRKQSLA